MERKRRDALIFGGALGAGAGAVLAGAPGALIGLVTVAPLTALAKPGALWGRILHSALLMALVGALLGTVLDPLPVAIIIGALVGALGVRVLKLALGLAVGVAVGPARGRRRPLAGATTALVYRSLAAYAYRKRPLVRIMAEAVPAEELRYVVPFEARTKLVGADYVEQLAELRGGTFRRNPPDVGILASLDALAGPTFDPALTHPLIREFYEHTSRFKLSIVPEWRTVDEARLRALQAGRRRAARPGRDPLEHRGGPARDGVHHRHPSSSTTARRSTSAAGSAPSPTPASRSTSASTRASATRAAATSASASRSRARTSPPRCSRATSTATGCC